MFTLAAKISSFCVGTERATNTEVDFRATQASHTENIEQNKVHIHVVCTSSGAQQTSQEHDTKLESTAETEQRKGGTKRQWRGSWVTLTYQLIPPPPPLVIMWSRPSRPPLAQHTLVCSS